MTKQKKYAIVPDEIGGKPRKGKEMITRYSMTNRISEHKYSRPLGNGTRVIFVYLRERKLLTEGRK